MNREASSSEPDAGSLTEDKPLLTIEEAAQRLGISRTTAYRYVSSGELETVTLGRLRRVPAECLGEFIAGLRIKQTARHRAPSGAV